MKDIVINAIMEALKSYYIGSQGRKPKNGFVLTMHPQTTYLLMDTPQWWVNFNSEVIEEYWNECLVKKNSDMKIGHFSLTQKDI